MNDWRPQEEILTNVLEVLQDSFIPDTAVQKNVQAKLTSLQSNSDLFNYFLLIFENSQQFDERTRSLAGLIIKNNMLYVYETTPHQVLQNMKSKCLKLLMDPSRDVRLSASALINFLALKGGIDNWPELLPHLILSLDSPNIDICETTIKTLINICEDYLSQRFNVSLRLDESIKKLLFKFTELTSHESLSIRKHSMKIMNEILQKFYESIQVDFETNKYLMKLFVAANETNEEIVILVCQGFVVFINNKDEAILPAIQDVNKYMLLKTADESEEVALQACEFWFSISKLPTCKEIVGGFLKDLIPVLLRNMKYSNYELGVLRDSLGKDSNMSDNPQDIKPFVKNCEDDDDPDIGWTLRKCSAASLDSMSLQFQDQMAEVAMPLIMEKLGCNDLLSKECGILALGAIADGCFKGLVKHLPNLIPPLIQCMDDDNSLIRSITCWTLSRYVRFIVHSPVDLYFGPVMVVLLKHSLDDNKRVQRAAISSFCFFQEEAKEKLLPHLEMISQTFLSGFNVYKMRSLYLLYDAIAVLSQAIGVEFKQVFRPLMHPVFEKFSTLDEYNNIEEFLAICECLSSVMTSVDVELVEYCKGVFAKCCRVIQDNVHSGGGDSEDYDKDLVVAALDLLVAMITNLKRNFAQFLVGSNLMDHLFYLIQDETVPVRQASLAMLGELIMYCYPYICNQIQSYIPAVVENLDRRFNGACNNAAWVVGKLCIALQAGISQYAAQILEHCVEIMQNTDGLQTMYKTVAIALCILGLVCPTDVVHVLKGLMRPLCLTIRNVGDCEEKHLAFKGFCELVVRMPEVLVCDFIFFCDAVASWNEIENDLRGRIASIIVAFRLQIGEEAWEKVYGNFPPMLKSRINVLYGI